MGHLLFSVAAKDLVVETFRGSGAGGQNRNKRETGVRIKHPASGATGQSCDERSQAQNKRTALSRLRDSREFTLWVKREVGRIAVSDSEIENRVNRSMRKENLVIETGGGPWVPLDEGNNANT